MFDHLEIKNFKSIEHLELSCRRVNVLIGEPNTGKSNILEALGLISYAGHSNEVSDFNGFVRCDDVSNLFYDGDLGRRLEIVLSPTSPMDNDRLILGLSRTFPHPPSIGILKRAIRGWRWCRGISDTRNDCRASACFY